MSGNADPRELDRRVRRTRDRLGDALIELLREKPFAAITVQDVLERAEVGRSTFYAHFSDKDDLLLSDMDEFLEHMAMGLARTGEPAGRVAPVRELFEHVAEQRELEQALRRAGKLHDFLELAQGHFARGIEERLAAGALPNVERAERAEERRAQAQALAGALLALMSWWLRNGMPGSPERMDELFHALVRGGAGAATPRSLHRSGAGGGGR